METKNALAALAARSQDSRLAIFRALVRPVRQAWLPAKSANC